jgi:ribonuclease BN (tRNA processing enzyme)
MKLTVLGSSDAFNSAARCHASYLLEGEGLPTVCVDFGATSLLALHRLGLRGSAIDAVVITHLHGDHFGGLPFLLLDGMYADRRTTPLTLIGPIGLADRLGRLFSALYPDIWERPRPFPLHLHELQPGASFDLPGLRIDTAAASHMDPPDFPLCLRLTGRLPSGGSRVVAFSGDTEPCEGLMAAASGADLLIAECSALAPPCGRHITWLDWRQLLTELLTVARVPRVLLSHLNSDVRARADELRCDIPAGVDVVFADDGLVYPLD